MVEDAAVRRRTELRIDRLAAPDGSIAVEILPEAGARLHRLQAFGRDILRTPDDPTTHLREPHSWGAYVMAPWCNRLEPGATTIGRRRLVLAATFRDGSAIHGQVLARPWEPREPGHYAVAAGDDGWPWKYEVDLKVVVESASLTVAVSLRNTSDELMPAGLGIHPWFRRPIRVAIAAASVYRSNRASPPLAEPVAGPTDRRITGSLARGLDATWTGLRGPEEPAAVLRWPSLGLEGTMHVRAPNRLVCAASPRTGDAIAVEPQTHAPQGLRRLLMREPDGLAMIQPGASLVLDMQLRFRKLSGRVA